MLERLRRMARAILGSRERRTAAAFRFDAASQTAETRRHWANADGLAADAAANSAVRELLRQRARYERFNNPYLCGQLRTLANDTIGIGPALQLRTINETVNEAVERRFGEWADEIGLGRKLRVAREVRASDGEIFIRLFRNPRLASPVKLDLLLIEADQVRSRDFSVFDDRPDGIEVDGAGNVLGYWILRHHPGANRLGGFSPADFDFFPARDIVHYFKAERPGQMRGIPEMVSSMNLHAERRNFRGSVLAAARSAASLGAVILSSEAGADDADLPTELDAVELEHGMMTMAPHGTEPHQMRPEQPATNYTEFDQRLIGEQARPFNMPLNVAAADSSRYNYASGRLDHQVYDRSIAIDRRDIEDVILRPVIQAWALEATSIPDFLPRRAGQVFLPTYRDFPETRVPCEWIWTERPHVDPEKEARAQELRLKSRTSTLSDEISRDRRDWRDQLAQSGREREAMDDAGLYQLDPQLAPRILEVLKNAAILGPAATVELLIPLGLTRARAEAIVESMPRPQRPAVTPAPAGGEGDDPEGNAGNGDGQDPEGNAGGNGQDPEGNAGGNGNGNGNGAAARRPRITAGAIE